MSSVATATEGLLINGERVDASDGQTFDVFDPSTGGRLATVPATKADVDRAVAAAHTALESKAWGGILPAERPDRDSHRRRDPRARRGARHARESRQRQAARQARTDVQVAARYFEFFAGIADKIMGHTIPAGPGWIAAARADRRLGADRAVELSDPDWRRGIAPAIAAGCTIVMKPSSEAPMTALRLGEIGLACGLPPGVVNIIPGTGSKPALRLRATPTSTS